MCITRKPPVEFNCFEILSACAPLPTEDSSSSPTDPPIAAMNHFDGELEPNQIVSDSDDRQEFQFSLKGRQANLFPNFESDSLNENFSPAR